MKLKEYITGLQEILKEHGDIGCMYASDDEGNSYHNVYSNGTICYLNKEDNDELYFEEDFGEDEELDINDFKKICIIN